MDGQDINRKEICFTGLHTCQNQSCSCEKSERIDRFSQLLSRLTAASRATDYEEQISATVAAICTVCIQYNFIYVKNIIDHRDFQSFQDEQLVPPLQLVFPAEFDEYGHIIDEIAQQYLKQASKSVQNLIPLRSLADGNCLFNSVVSLIPDSGISAVELRGLST